MKRCVLHLFYHRKIIFDYCLISNKVNESNFRNNYNACSYIYLTSLIRFHQLEHFFLQKKFLSNEDINEFVDTIFTRLV